MAGNSDKATEMISDFLARKATRANLERYFLQELEKAKKLPVKQASDASLGDVQLWFGIALDNSNPDLELIQPIKMPEALVDRLAMIRSALGTTSGALNEVSTRIILDNLLIHAHAIATTTTTTTTTQTRQGQAIHMHADKGLWLVRIKRSKLEGEFYLTGRPDYAFWYGRVKETEVNVVIVKAKAEEKPGLARCLAYMGMIRMKRMKAGKNDCTVYGACAREQVFECLKINNSGIVSYRRLHIGNGDYAPCLGIFVHFIQAAILMSPLHSPQSSGQTHLPEESDGSEFDFDDYIWN